MPRKSSKQPIMMERLREGVDEILKLYDKPSYPDYWELVLDVQHDVELLVRRLKLDPTPVRVFVYDRQLVVRVGQFLSRN